jgi:hypothetical protein
MRDSQGVQGDDVVSTPLTLEDLPRIFGLLSQSLSHVPEIQKQCECELKQVETRSNFASCLVEIISHREADYSSRWLASVYLKNFVTKNWRTRLKGAIPDEEKNYIRGKLLDRVVDEPDDQVAIQLALSVSKIGRFDYPNEWPHVFDILLERLNQLLLCGGDSIDPLVEMTRRRLYLVLHFLLRELSSKRLAVDQKTYESLCSNTLYSVITGLWVKDVEQLSRLLESAPDVSVVLLERVLLELKCLKRVLVNGFPSDSKSLCILEDISKICPVMVQTFAYWLEVVYSSDRYHVLRQYDGGRLHTLMKRCVRKQLKLLILVQETHCWSFFKSGSLLPYLELLCTQVSSQSGCCNAISAASQEQTVFVKLVLTGIYNIIKCPGYKGSTSSLLMPPGKAKEQKALLESLSSDVGSMIKQFWQTNTRDQSILFILISNIFPLTLEELILWDSDGEEFHREMEHVAQAETVRGCAEMVFTALLESNRDVLSKFMIEMIHQINLYREENRAQPSGTAATSTLALHDAAVLHAAALGAYDLYDYIDFGAILTKSLLPLISSGSSIAAPLRREALRMISHWVSKIKPQHRPDIYTCLFSVLREEDKAMYLMACSALQSLMEDWDFDVEQFRPLAPEAVALLIAMLSQCTDYESHLEIFSVLNLVIDHLQEKTRDCAPIILEMVPRLWDSSEGQSLLRIQILLALQRLVHALGRDSPMAYPVVLPLLQFTIQATNMDPSNPLEDGILLWIVVLRHVDQPNVDVVAPLHNMLQIMQQSTEHIFTGTRCITSSVLLFGDAILEKHGNEINAVLGSFVGAVKDKAMIDVILCLDIIIQACPMYGVQCMADTIVKILMDISDPSKSAIVVAPFLVLMSRISLRSLEQFSLLFDFACQQFSSDTVAMMERSTSNACNEGFAPPQKLFLSFLDLWLDKFDGIGQAGMRKIAALGLCSAIRLNNMGVMNRFADILSHITGVWLELEDRDADVDSIALSFPIAGTGPRDDFIPVSVDLEEAEGEPTRRQRIFNDGPIVKMSIKSYFQECMKEASAIHGIECLQKAIQNTDPELQQMFDKIMH